ncbi:MAG: hypothetical protein J0I31_03165 [Rhizobiales bacterium]|nr:hypothetical protein [Hyphomicrobiales bacterium]
MNEMLRPPVMGANASVRSRFANKVYLVTKEAAEYLTEITGVPFSAATLDSWRTRPPRSGGPRFQKFGRRIVYAQAELDRWHNACLSAPFASTSEVHSR